MPESIRKDLAYYFGLSLEELKTVWNLGDNDLPREEEQMVEQVIRHKEGFPGAAKNIEVCGRCYLLKSACSCEKSWW